MNQKRGFRVASAAVLQRAAPTVCYQPTYLGKCQASNVASSWDYRYLVAVRTNLEVFRP